MLHSANIHWFTILLVVNKPTPILYIQIKQRFTHQINARKSSGSRNNINYWFTFQRI